MGRRSSGANTDFLSFELVGATELERALVALGTDKDIRRTMRRALVDVGRPIVAMAQRNAPVHTGRMQAKIAVSSTLSRRQRAGGAYKRSPDTAHAHIGTAPKGPGVLTEFGTGPRYHRKTGKFVGAAPAQPFLRPAWEAGKGRLLEDYKAALWSQIAKSTKRIARASLKAGRRRP